MSELDNLAGGIVAVGVGGAAAAAIEPVLEPARQQAWIESLSKVLDVGQLAELVAQAIITKTAAESEAARTGYNPNKLAALIQLALEAPPYAEALDLRRRGKITDAQLTHALEKAQIEPQYWDALRDLVDERLAPAQIALAIVRSLMKDPGFLPVTLDTTGGKVPAYGVSPIDPLAEATASGITEERLRIMVGEIGLPMSLQEAASAVFRNIIERADFNRAVLEGDTRPEWADAIFQQARQILTAAQYIEGHLRGWIDLDAMNAGTAKHGMSAADTDLLYKISGRPITLKQINTGLARGGSYPSTYDDVPEPYRKALQESNIRPEWASLDYANRYTYPSGFQVKAEATSGDLLYDDAHQLLLEMGWVPKWAAFFAAKWTGGKAAAADPWAKRAETQLWTTTHRSFLNREIDEATAVSNLQTLGVTPEAISQIIALWTLEQDLIRKQLTPAQISKAFKKAEKNPATGQPWTRDEAIAALVSRGYNVNDANSLLDL